MRYCFILFIAASLIIACSSSKDFTNYKQQFTGDTISSLEEKVSDSGFFKAANGKIYPVFSSVDSSLIEESLSAARPTILLRAAPPPEAEAQVDLVFAESTANPVREEAKTTKAGGAAKKASSINSLFNSLPDDNDMEAFNIGTQTTRVTPEQKNISLKRVYIYLIIRENDNDYHMIIGDKPNYKDATVRFNAEISALPKNFPANADLLRRIREKIAENIGKIPKKASGNNGTSIPVKLSGSLFYDAHHKGKFGGQGDIKATTIWEIHPVTAITFL